MAKTLKALSDTSLTIKLGQLNMSEREVLEIREGSMIQLDSAVGEPVEVMLAGHKFAEGEIVVVGRCLGVRITRIVKPA